MTTAELIARLSDRPAPVRPPPRLPVMVALWTVASLASVALFVSAMLGLRPDLAAAFRSPGFLATMGALAGLLASTAWSGFVLAVPGRRFAGPARWLPAIFLGLFNLALTLHLVPRGAAIEDGLSTGGLLCSAVVAGLAVLPGVFFFLLAHRLASVNPRAAARAIGLAVGAVGALGLTVHCPNQHCVHLLLYHSVPLFLLEAAAVAIGARWLRW